MKIYSRLTYFDVVLTTGRKLIPPILNNFTCWCSPKSNSWHIGMEGWLGEKGKNGVGLWCLCKEEHAGLNQNLAKQSSMYNCTSGHLSFWQKKTFSFSHWSVQLEEICCRHLELSNKVNLTPLWKSPTTKIKDCHLWKRPHQQILNQYRTNIEQILNQYWTNIRQIPNKYQTIIKASEAHSPVKN